MNAAFFPGDFSAIRNLFWLLIAQGIGVTAQVPDTGGSGTGGSGTGGSGTGGSGTGGSGTGGSGTGGSGTGGSGTGGSGTGGQTLLNKMHSGAHMLGGFGCHRTLQSVTRERLTLAQIERIIGVIEDFGVVLSPDSLEALINDV